MSAEALHQLRLMQPIGQGPAELPSSMSLENYRLSTIPFSGSGVDESAVARVDRNYEMAPRLPGMQI